MSHPKIDKYRDFQYFNLIYNAPIPAPSSYLLTSNMPLFPDMPLFLDMLLFPDILLRLFVAFAYK